MGWRLTVRTDGQVDHARFEGLELLLSALEKRGRALADSASNRPVDLKVTRFDPAQQVVARLELAGPERLLPSVRAGVDVHGDGSTEAFRGGIRRVALERRPGEDAFGVLRRSLADVLKAAGTDAA